MLKFPRERAAPTLQIWGPVRYKFGTGVLVFTLFPFDFPLFSAAVLFSQSFIMVALRNRADHNIFILIFFFLLSFFLLLSFFFFLA